ncbi:MAG: DUF1059 domain-containing protein [Ignavibacteriaceae bacterium]|nr:DUF1059 domain-containing protein [Ignavibacteriaceae bacterium]
MILYQLKCKDLGFDSCDFIATGNSETELKRKFIFHSMCFHEKELNEMELVQKIEFDNNLNQLLDKQTNYFF